MEKIDIKHKIPVVGKYTRGVYVCPHCDNNMLNRHFESIIGFADAYVGLVAVTECDKCFEKFYSHAGESYEYFLDCIDAGTQKHFSA